MKILSLLLFCLFVFSHFSLLKADEPLAYVIDDAGAILPIYNQEHLAIFQDTCARRTYVNNQIHFYYSEEAYSKGYPLAGQLSVADFSPYPSQGLPDYNKRCFEADYYTPRPYQSKNEWSTVSKWVGAAIFCCAAIKWKVFGKSKEESDAKRKQAALQALRREAEQRILAARKHWFPQDFLVYYNLQNPGNKRTWETDFLKDELFSQIPLYTFAGFRNLLRWHPNYEGYIEQIKNKVAKDSSFFKYHYKAGEFESIINQMWAAILQERDAIKKKQAAQKKPQREQEARRQSINARMQTVCKPLIETYQAADLSNLSVAERQQKIHKNRQDALTHHNRNCDAFKEKTYQLLDNVQKILNEYSMQAADFAKCYGNMIQQALHEEFLGIMSDTAQLRYVQDHRSQERRAAATTIMGFVQAGNTFKNTGYIPNAITCADICWSFLECQKFLFNVTVDVSLLAFQTVVAGTKGVVKGTINGGLKIIQPVRTFEELVVETTHLSALVEESFGNGFKDRQMRAIKLKEQRDQDAQDLALGLVMHEDLLRRDLNACKEAIGVSAEHVRNALGNVLQNINRETYLHGVEKVTEIGTEAWLTGVTLRSLSGLVKNGSNTLSDFMNTGGPKSFYDLPLNNNTFGAMVAYESTIADVVAAHGVQVVGGSVAEALDKISEFAPVLAMSSSGPNGSGSGGGNPPVTAGNTPNPPMDIIQAMQPLSTEERALLLQYNGLAMHNGHPVIPPFEHTWVANISRSGTITGFHQDRMGYYRKLGLRRNIVMHAEGFHTAEVYVSGTWERRSYFPDNWDVNDLTNCYYDVIKNPDTIVPQVGRTLYKKTRSSGVEISVVIEDKSGIGITYFPNLRLKP